MKIADASSGEAAGDNSGFEANDSDSPLHRDDGEMRMHREPSVYFQAGQQVKLRQVGLGFAQVVGQIEEIKDNRVIVLWRTGDVRKGKRETFDMDKAMIALDII